MSRTHVAATSLLFIAAGCAAAAQGAAQIQVLQMPESAKHQPRQSADRVVSIHYEGRLSASRSIWVRVFREPLSDLVDKYPRQTPAGHCVVYTHVALFRVDHGYDRELRIGDLEDFFSMARFQYDQTLTMVFEEGVDPSTSGPLYLEKSAVPAYFANAVTVQLTASDAIDGRWKQDAAREVAANHPPSGGFFDRLFGVKPVAAAGRAVGPMPGAAPPPPPMAEPDYLMPHCQTVRPVPYEARGDTGTSPEGALEALAPAVLRASGTCGE